MSKIIYLVTTTNCAACELQKSLLEVALQQRPDIKLVVKDYKEALPAWFYINVKFTDFPTTILVSNDLIKYSFVGTKAVNKIIKLFNDINF